MKNKFKITLGMVLLVSAVISFAHISTVHAASTIVVNSTADTVADDGECTLREAIIAANDDTASGANAGECIAGSGADTINFNITSGTSFSVTDRNSVVKTGYTIQPATALPTIDHPVTIDGYSQPGALTNNATAPNPLNGTLLIEIDGSSAGSADGLKFTGSLAGAAGSQISGLVINQFDSAGIVLAAANVFITGNYIGTSPDGLMDRGNGWAGITTDNSGPNISDAHIGGLNPNERNLISGNESSGIYPSTGWVVQGNYIGTDRTGTVAMPNSTTDPSGALSIDNCSDVLVGGTDTGATNLVSGNASHGIAPDNCPGTKIQGNLIGTDWTGQAALPNHAGVVISGDQTGSVIGGTSASARNIISGNTLTGMSSAATGGLRVEGNYIGLNIDGDQAISNGTGVLVGGNTIIGGSNSGRNVISGNTTFNISIFGTTVPTSGTRVYGNYIGTNAAGQIDANITNVQGEGIRVSGNTSDNIIGGDVGNRIAGNRGSGVAVRSWTITSFSLTATPHTTAILGNEIYGNVPGGSVPSSKGMGIDLYEATVASVSFPADIATDSVANEGPTLNDASDADTGANNYMNFPVLNTVTQSGTTLSLNYSLDAADSPTDQYRIEFFANDTADPSGYGEGQTFLGAVTAGNGNNQTASLTLPAGTNLTGKVLSATTTAIDSTTDSGFGSTSEFSANIPVVLAASTTNPSTNDNLAITGSHAIAPTIAGILISSLALMTTFLRRKYIYRLHK
jgi:CSLREA domain-containing protein